MKLKSGVMLLIFCSELTYGAVIHDTIIPDNSSCVEAGAFGCLCSQPTDCDLRKHMECIDFKCVCMYPMHRMYDNRTRKCFGLVGSRCKVGSGGVKCLRNSECQDGRCVCREGYSMTNGLKCMTNFGEECGPHQCNSDRGLACKSGTCQCLDSSYTYSAVTRRCFDPEVVVANVIRTYGPRLTRDVLIQHTFQVLRRLLHFLIFPFRLLRF